ncbi:unnamed protein product [Adineta ricciae]|uniref:F-box domain-containing protein n=1 Tax=Adineta ricciae TaxID=249248 RepID=A0A814NF42_ADIRI|nr:unnamed protein product [Adineta ricciae]CAF1091390.1 unnamed protein product [Adineta ricciae]
MLLNENKISVGGALGVLTLESLPDELFYDIFYYLSAQDLYDGFYNLNYRFRSILATLTNLYSEITIKDETNSLASRYFASRIVALSIKHVESFDLSAFSTIRSLTLLAEPNREQCQSIQRFLPHLEQLVTCKSSTRHFSYSTSASHFVFTNAYPFLRSSSLNLVSYKDEQSWTHVLSLRFLSIRIIDLRIYPQILRTCPSLVRFQLEFKNNFQLPKLFYRFDSHSSLRYLHLRLHSTPYSYCLITALLLSLVPNLRQFSLHGCLSEAGDINIESLAEILHQHVPHLDHFYLTMAIQQTLSTNNWQKMRQLHSLFHRLTIESPTPHSLARLTIQSKKNLI